MRCYSEAEFVLLFIGKGLVILFISQLEVPD